MFRGSRFNRLYLLLIIGLLFATMPFKNVSAARVDSAKATVSDSRPSTTATYTFVVDMSTSTNFAAGDTMIFDWPAGFTFPANGTWVTGDFTFNDGSARTITSVGAAPTCNAGTSNVSVTADATNLVLTVTACSTYTSSANSAVVTFTVGNTNKVTNATAGTYQINIAGNYGDDAQDVIVAMVAGVSVSASIDETLTTSVNAVVSGSCQTTGGTTITSTSTTVPFGNISATTFYDICQDIRVATNAASGYATTIQSTGAFTSGSNTISKGICDASCTDSTAAAWSSTANAGYGYCLKDTAGDGAATADSTGWATANQCGGGTQKFKTIANAGSAQAAQTIMSSATSASDDRSNVGWRLNTLASQAAGTYALTGVYITTPTF